MHKLADIEEYINTLEIVINERQVNITKEYINGYKDDLEGIIISIYDQFTELVKVEFDIISKENPKNLSSFQILKRCNKELKRIEKINKATELRKDDIRYVLFDKINSIFIDNIKLRYKINEYIEAFLKQTEYKIEEYYESFKTEAE